jgi:predicted house-cleaning NTP pyrophosphatase (Maf/HAM1 superfamily)
MIIESVEGSRSNVVGLPLERTLAALRRFSAGA